MYMKNPLTFFWLVSHRINSCAYDLLKIGKEIPLIWFAGEQKVKFLFCIFSTFIAIDCFLFIIVSDFQIVYFDY